MKPEAWTENFPCGFRCWIESSTLAKVHFSNKQCGSIFWAVQCRRSRFRNTQTVRGPPCGVAGFAPAISTRNGPGERTRCTIKTWTACPLSNVPNSCRRSRARTRNPSFSSADCCMPLGTATYYRAGSHADHSRESAEPTRTRVYPVASSRGPPTSLFQRATRSSSSTAASAPPLLPAGQHAPQTNAEFWAAKRTTTRERDQRTRRPQGARLGVLGLVGVRTRGPAAVLDRLAGLSGTNGRSHRGSVEIWAKSPSQGAELPHSVGSTKSIWKDYPTCANWFTTFH